MSGVGPEVDWRALVPTLLAPVAVTDGQGRPLVASPAYHGLVDQVRAAEQVQEVVRTERAARGPAGEGVQTCETALTAPDGLDLPTRVTLTWGEDGSCRWCLVQVEPEAGRRDALTGLATREALVLRLEQALARRRRHGGEVEVLVVDLDRFKVVNDRHGHVVGDEVLVEVARRLRQLSRPEDTVCRWGGDEFVLLLDDPGREASEAVCARVAAALAEPVTTGHGPVVHVTASCGSVRAGQDAEAVQLMHHADLQMYERKRSSQGADALRRSELTARLARARARAAELQEALEHQRRRALQSLPGPGAQGERGQPSPS